MRASPRDVIELVQRPGVLREVFDHACREYPRECCGLILASGAVRCCVNVADELHALDPASFPRESRNGFALGFDDLRFLADSFTSGDPVRIVYHSHPDARPDFSAADRAAAMPDGQPAYPGICHFIVAVRHGCAAQAKLYAQFGSSYVEVTTVSPPSAKTR